MKSTWLLFSTFLVGCSISSKTTYTDELVKTDHEERVIAGSRQYRVSPKFEGTALQINVAQQELCETQDTPILHRRAEIERTAHPSPLAYVLPGVAVLGLGAAVAFRGDFVALQAGLSPQPPLTYQIVGGAFGVGGLSLVLAGVVHGIRAIDRHKDLGEIKGPPIIKKFPCNDGPVRVTPVALQMRQGSELNAVTDESGSARLSFADTPMQDIPRHGVPVPIQVRGSLLNLSLSETEIDELKRALEQDSDTRASKDLRAQRQAECTRLTGLAEAISIDANSAQEVERESKRAWEKARVGCGELWTPESQGKLSNTYQQIATNAEARTHRSCIGALLALEAIKHSLEVGDADEKAETACQGVASESSRLAKAQTRITRLAEQEARTEKARALAEAQKAKLRLAKLKQQESAVREREASKRLMCCDGTASPSCSCYGSHRGCCSHHGGVCGCE